MKAQLQIDIQQIDHNTAIINLIGDLTTSADGKPIHEAYDTVSAAGFNNLILNFDENNAIYSPGIPILLDIIIDARQKGQRLLIAIPNTHCQKLFRLMGITKLAGVFNSLEEAKRQVM